VVAIRTILLSSKSARPGRDGENAKLPSANPLILRKSRREKFDFINKILPHNL
jgi:hypothetical protein